MLLQQVTPTSPAQPDRSDHRALRQRLRDVRNSRNRLELHAELTRLRRFLEEHFEREEAPGGFFESVRDAGIASERAMASLERSHRDMVESLDRIVAALGRSNAQALDVAPDLDALLRTIESHEVLEDDLLHALLGRELGGGD